MEWKILELVRNRSVDGLEVRSETECQTMDDVLGALGSIDLHKIADDFSIKLQRREPDVSTKVIIMDFAIEMYSPLFVALIAGIIGTEAENMIVFREQVVCIAFTRDSHGFHIDVDVDGYDPAAAGSLLRPVSDACRRFCERRAEVIPDFAIDVLQYSRNPQLGSRRTLTIKNTVDSAAKKLQMLGRGADE